MKRSLTFVLVILAMASTMAATRRPKYSNSRARDAGAIMQGIGGFINGVSEAAARQQQQQQVAYERQQRQQAAYERQQQLEVERQRQLEYQRQQEQLRQQQLEAERQRQLDFQRRQVELERQRAEVVRERRQSEDEDGIGGISYNRWMFWLTAGGLLVAVLAFLKKG